MNHYFSIAFVLLLFSCSEEHTKKNQLLDSNVIGLWGKKNSSKADILFTKDSVQYLYNIGYIQNNDKYKYSVIKDTLIIYFPDSKKKYLIKLLDRNTQVISYKDTLLDPPVLFYDTAYRIVK